MDSESHSNSLASATLSQPAFPPPSSWLQEALSSTGRLKVGTKTYSITDVGAEGSTKEEDWRAHEWM